MKRDAMGLVAYARRVCCGCANRLLGQLYPMHMFMLVSTLTPNITRAWQLISDSENRAATMSRKDDIPLKHLVPPHPHQSLQQQTPLHLRLQARRGRFRIPAVLPCRVFGSGRRLVLGGLVDRVGQRGVFVFDVFTREEGLIDL
jgi:hypothetical protein